jgi:hypothetical protein
MIQTMVLGASNSLRPLLAYVNHPKGLASSKGCHTVITTSIPTNAMDRRLEENIGKYGGRGSLTSGKSCVGEVDTGKMFTWPQYN